MLRGNLSPVVHSRGETSPKPMNPQLAEDLFLLAFMVAASLQMPLCQGWVLPAVLCPVWFQGFHMHKRFFSARKRMHNFLMDTLKHSRSRTHTFSLYKCL